jgi:hypothetical protein
MRVANRAYAGSLSGLMKTWAALVFIPIVLLVSACEKHPVSDLQKVDADAALATPAGR